MVRDETFFDDFWVSYMCDDGQEQDWRLDYTDIYAAAEAFMIEAIPSELEGTRRDLDALFALPSEQDRRVAIANVIEDVDDDPGSLDAFLADFSARLDRQLAGDLSQPLVDPRGPRKRRGGPPVSVQGYDVSLPSAGSFDSAQVAEAVVGAVLKSYADSTRAFFARSAPGITRRLPPLRMRFDREVGLVAVRDGQHHRTRLAVVLLHDVGGEPLVYNSFPMEEVPEPPRFEALSVMFAGWLHADWVDDYPAGAWDPVEQVRRFAASEPRETVERAAEELAALRATGTEDDRRAAVRGLCSYFVPRPPGQLDSFLAEAAEVLAG